MIRTSLLPFAMALIVAAPALAQAPSAQSPAVGEAAKAIIGTWEFSSADRTKVCTATFSSDAAPAGFKVVFDANCATLFPLIERVAGWRFPDNDNLFLLDAGGKTLVEFSEVETGLYEAPTPGVGVLFLQNAAAAVAPQKAAGEVAGVWAVRRGGATVCVLTLGAAPLRDGFALTVTPGCDAAMTRLNLTQWRLDRGELVLTPARGTPWRFEEGDGGAWRRIPEGVDNITLVKQ